jgi:choline kinase
VTRSAVVLAAGRGSRIAAVTSDPKCLLEVSGKSLLRHHLDSLEALGFEDVVVVVGYGADRVRDHLADRLADRDPRMRIAFVENEDVERFGNAMSMCLGLESVTGPCIVIDADLIYEQDVLGRFLSPGPEDSILVGLGKLDDVESTKILTDRDGRVTVVVEKRLLSPAEESSFLGEAMGVLMFTEPGRVAILRRSDQFFDDPGNITLNWESLLNDHLREHAMSARLVEFGRWIEIDTPQDYAEARRIFAGTGRKVS